MSFRFGTIIRIPSRNQIQNRNPSQNPESGSDSDSEFRNPNQESESEAESYRIPQNPVDSYRNLEKNFVEFCNMFKVFWNLIGAYGFLRPFLLGCFARIISEKIDTIKKPFNTN